MIDTRDKSSEVSLLPSMFQISKPFRQVERHQFSDEKKFLNQTEKLLLVYNPIKELWPPRCKELSLEKILTKNIEGQEKTTQYETG